MKILWTAQSNNTKNGNIIQGWVGQTKKETLKSCEGCPQLPSKDKPTTCYAWASQVHVGLLKVHDSYKRNGWRHYTLAAALKKRSKDAKAVRGAAIGDAAAIPLSLYKTYVSQVRKEGLAWLNYTHKWRTLKAKFWRKNTMASCDSIEQVDEAAKLGWRAAVILPASFTGKRTKTAGGEDIVICPAILTKNLGLPEDKLSTCNSCRLCDASRPGPHIGFPAHGPAFRNKGKKLPVV